MKFWLILMCGLFLLNPIIHGLPVDPKNPEIQENFESVPGEYVVQLKAGQETTSFHYDIKTRFDDIAVIQVSGLVRPSRVLEDLRSLPEVEYAEPNYIYKINRTPNDPLLRNLWGMINSGQISKTGQRGEYGIDIGARKAWDIQTGNPNLVVAVIDTGVESGLRDLKGNMWINKREIPGNGRDDDRNGYVDDVHGYNFADNNGNSNDKDGHGSHCAGVIGAKGNNASGIVGVAWNVKIMALKFLSSGGGTLANAVRAIDYARRMGAHIMSNSWGGGGYSSILRGAIERAHRAGILFVAAAGNSRRNNDSIPTYPASYSVPNVISVAAVDNRGALASFSNFGVSSVDLAAPGVDILSSTPYGYSYLSGTSMATPHVSGTAALLLSEEPSLTPKRIVDRLIRTAKPLPNLRGRVASGGMVNAYRALIGDTNNEEPDEDNDPSRWTHWYMPKSTSHPYRGSSVIEFRIYVPRAEKIALYFNKFKTEKGYDKLYIYNEYGRQVAAMSGDLGQTYSPVIKGKRLTVRFVSDRYIEDYGFDLFGVAFR